MPLFHVQCPQMLGCFFSGLLCSPLTCGCLSISVGYCVSLCSISVFWDRLCNSPFIALLKNLVWTLVRLLFCDKLQSQPIGFHPLISSSGDSKWWHSTGVRGLDFRGGLPQASRSLAVDINSSVAGMERGCTFLVSVGTWSASEVTFVLSCLRRSSCLAHTSVCSGNNR